MPTGDFPVNSLSSWRLLSFKSLNEFIVSDRAGIGLSLALCQMIAEVHEGTLTITNHQPQGVCYVLALPIPDSEWVPHTIAR
jgi:K+-sensing histidine kinase KdpD